MKPYVFMGIPTVMRGRPANNTDIMGFEIWKFYGLRDWRF